jgi:hypothetical protein
MSSELKIILEKVALEDNKQKESDFEEGIDRYKSLLIKLAKEKSLDVILSIEGSPQPDLNKNRQDLDLLERALLVEGQTKYTHHNEYRQYKLTPKGTELAEKLIKETLLFNTG